MQVSIIGPYTAVDTSYRPIVTIFVATCNDAIVPNSTLSPLLFWRVTTAYTVPWPRKRFTSLVH